MRIALFLINSYGNESTVLVDVPSNTHGRDMVKDCMRLRSPLLLFRCIG
ncbi:hypothetical protein TOL_1332 [Thalassolituus oleivorans MIL-1]|uniref:Uncharacterized protein n=1 Tax=Thalassolituus oleivorans MIL-1 TaxID=1298593 RepID=M5DRG3_9GAMM|nr:hypothetical protein TOL_1332 [Thalassolituus oleivorans MIL-1]